MSDVTCVAHNIKLHREKMGLTQRALAEKLGVSFQAISAWERGLSVPDLDNMILLSRFFGITVDAMLSSTQSDLYVGIDGGGTKTEFVLFTPDGTIEKIIKLGGSNPNDNGLEACVDILTRGLELLLAGRTPAAVFGGIAGSSSDQLRNTIAEKLRERFHARVYIDSDMENILSCAFDPNDAYALISGTGSCLFVRKNGVRYRLGGWGYLLDQAGSAYDVGKDALRLMFAAEDGMREKTPMTEALEQALGGDPYAAIPEIYQKGRVYIASLAQIVVEAAQNGESDARDILWQNASHLAMIIKTAIKRFGQPKDIVASGGFISNKLFRDMVEQQAQIHLQIPEVPPVFGACVRCLTLENKQIIGSFRNEFLEHYRRFVC